MKTCDCLTYVRLNLEVLARNRGIMLLTALLALVFCIPVFLSVPTGADYLYGRASIEDQRALLVSQSLTAFMTLPHRSSTASLPTKGRALIGRLKARRTPESITMRLPITTIYCSRNTDSVI